ncbi:MAG: NAD-dependent epimerase/dehydratase family protein, partial [Methanomassiliicoccales archaeon]|nr:NAD-dependent epimerase/dehydratase family protein [Methanomassiliicoccales archaeon]
SFAVPDFIGHALKEKKIVIMGDGRPRRSFCYESDLAIMMLRSMMHDEGRTLNAGNDRPEVSIKELADIVAESVGSVKVEVKEAPSAGPPSRYVPDMDRMRRTYAPEVDVRTGVARVIRHIRESTSIDDN